MKTERVRFVTARDNPRAAYEVEVDQNVVTFTALRWSRYGHYDEKGKLRYAFGTLGEAQFFANILTRDLPALIEGMFNVKQP